MKKLLIATTNTGKLKEFTNFLQDLSLEFLSLKDVGIFTDVEEAGKTYKENSELKATFYAKKSNLPAIADDGGLEIDFLNGAPGLQSKRWVGKNSTDKKIIEHMKKISQNLPDNNRNASFKISLSLALPNGKVWTVEDKVDGIIAKKPYLKLSKGYPYRSFLYIPELKKFYHEDQLSDRELKLYNHRYKAVQKLKPIIIKELIG